MAAPVHTERFVQANVAGVFKTYWVPDGRRAIVMTANFLNQGAAAGTAALYIAGWGAYEAPIPAHSTVAMTNLRLVAYGGEDITAIVAIAPMVAIVGGYLLPDPSGASAPPGQTTVSTDAPIGWRVAHESASPLPHEGEDVELRTDVAELIRESHRGRVA